MVVLVSHGRLVSMAFRDMRPAISESLPRSLTFQGYGGGAFIQERS
jgi:hypothetical protein